ncbi:MAG: 4-alpha-glucanotransferase [Ruthenibacterium lactatiformans]
MAGPPFSGRWRPRVVFFQFYHTFLAKALNKAPIFCIPKPPVLYYNANNCKACCPGGARREGPFMRESGILMPVSSLPGPFGIGTLGKSAYDFVDFLARAGQRVWQILPLSPTGFGNSPYQSCSAFAASPYFIDFEPLRKKGLLKREEYAALPFGKRPLRWIMTPCARRTFLCCARHLHGFPNGTLTITITFVTNRAGGWKTMPCS